MVEDRHRVGVRDISWVMVYLIIIMDGAFKIKLII